MSTSDISDLEQIFTDIYRTKKWAYGCGSGSTEEYTEQLIPKLQAIIYRLKVKTLLDAPCGRYSWIDRLKVNMYIGGDIVKDLYEENSQKYPLQYFSILDITKDPLPKADLWLCRACLYHLSRPNIDKVIQNYLRSDIPYVLFTTSEGHEEYGKDGDYRPFNMEYYGLPKPLEKFDDGPLMKMGLWSKDQFNYVYTVSSPR